MADPVGVGETPSLFPKTAGERLRDARQAMGLDLAEVAARTRIPLRHLETIETSSYGALPSSTYAIGFAKGYARAVGVSEVEIANAVRGELAQTNFRNPEFVPYEMDDPKRVPPRGLALGGVLLALLIVISIGLWYSTSLFRSDSAPVVAEPTAEPTTAAAPAPAPTPSSTGQVTLTAADSVWLRIYDATGKTLFEKTLQPGERYDVPQDANGPMINVGRPDQLQVTLNGAALPALGDGRIAIKNVGVSAAALSARAAGTQTMPVPAASATPLVMPRPRPKATHSQRPTPTITPSMSATSTPVVTPPVPTASPTATPTP